LCIRTYIHTYSICTCILYVRRGERREERERERERDDDDENRCGWESESCTKDD